ncbi:MAG: hypothetical protein QOF44_3988, partial [Streptomyces sp.]|nr:hypothetical protein [Streptomyces sp.]
MGDRYLRFAGSAALLAAGAVRDGGRIVATASISGITVNAVAPGFIETRMIRRPGRDGRLVRRPGVGWCHGAGGEGLRPEPPGRLT